MSLVLCENFVLHTNHGPMFNPLSFEVNSGKILGLVGPNGVGKSLLLNCFLRGYALKPFHSTGNLKTLNHHTSGSTFFLPQLQAPDIHMPYRLEEVASFHGKFPENFSWFDKKMASRSWNEASGGERMRALLARAFASKAKLLLLDEPFNHLDGCAVADVRNAMQDYVIKAPFDRGIIFVSHLENDIQKNYPLSELNFPTLKITSASHITEHT
jgi:ATPase subunit of ABC transporter with duplicated ATPase domains